MSKGSIAFICAVALIAIAHHFDDPTNLVLALGFVLYGVVKD